MVNWGIIGYGRMGKVFHACFKDHFKETTLKAIASKTLPIENLDNSCKYFSEYQDLLEYPEVDAIYIATLNNTHKDLILSAIKNKKKILCEKPIVLNVNEIIEINDLLKKKENTIFEAVAYRVHPQLYFINDILKNNTFGKIKKIISNFGFKVKNINNQSRLFNKKLGGGVILDLGCYIISFLNFFKKKNNKFEILNSKSNYCNTGVEIDSSLEMNINDEIEALGKVSFTENLSNICKIYFDNAIITITQPWVPNEKTYLEIDCKNNYYKKFFHQDKDIYTQQLRSISDIFNGDTSELDIKKFVDINESLEISKVLDLWKKK